MDGDKVPLKFFLRMPDRTAITARILGRWGWKRLCDFRYRFAVPVRPFSGCAVCTLAI